MLYRGCKNRSRLEVTDKDAHWAEMVLSVICDIDCPMLMYQAEKDVVEKALRMLFDDWELGKIKEHIYQWRNIHVFKTMPILRK